MGSVSIASLGAVMRFRAHLPKGTGETGPSMTTAIPKPATVSGWSRALLLASPLILVGVSLAVPTPATAGGAMETDPTRAGATADVQCQMVNADGDQVMRFSWQAEDHPDQLWTLLNPVWSVDDFGVALRLSWLPEHSSRLAAALQTLPAPAFTRGGAWVTDDLREVATVCPVGQPD